jgi:serine/threonine protein kinase/predicted TPR repeat methyltransferase
MTAEHDTPADRTSQLDEVVAAYLEAAEAGQSPSPQEWLARYPELAAELGEFFTAQEHFRQWAAPLEPSSTGPFLPATIDYAGPQPGPFPADPLALRPAMVKREAIRAGSVIVRQDAGFRVFDVKTGGMGIVYLAEDLREHRPGVRLLFALKTVADYGDWCMRRHAKPASADRETYDHLMRRFHREAEAWVHLGRHENIIWAIEAFEFAGKPYLLMEYADSGDLASWIAGGRLTVPLAVDFGIQFCEGMMHAVRAAGMVHRDIKPSNVLIAREKILRIADFGLSKAFHLAAEEGGDASGPTAESGLSEAGAGTLPYMAPEQFYSIAAADTRSDIFSFGAMLYEMVTRKRLFTATGAREHLALRRQGAPPAHASDQQIPTALSEVIARCVAWDSDDRWQSFEDVRRALSEVYERLFGRTSMPSSVGGPAAEDHFVRETHSLCQLAHYDKAVLRATEGLRQFPESALLWINKGMALLGLNCLAEARPCLERAVRLQPKNPLAWVNLSAIHAKEGNADETVRAAETAVRFDEKCYGAWANLGGALRALGRHEDAAFAYCRAAELKPSDWRIQFECGRSLSRLGRNAEACAALWQAANINPEDADVWFHLATSLRQAGRHEDALGAIDRSLEIDRAQTICWIVRGVLFWESRRDRAAARACFEKALELDPASREARACLVDLDRRMDPPLPERPRVQAAGPPRRATESIPPDDPNLAKLLSLPILPHDFDNWCVLHKEKPISARVWDAPGIVSRNNNKSARWLLPELTRGEWHERDFDIVWSHAGSQWIPLKCAISCLCRYTFRGSRREITRIFRYGEDKFAVIREMD